MAEQAPQGNMQQLQSSLQGPTAAPTETPQAPQAMPAAGPEMGPSPLEGNLNNLPEEHKAFVAEHLTPEMAVVIGLVTGDMAITEQLRPFVNPERMLVPVNRAEFESMAQQKMAQADPADPTQAAQAAPTPASKPETGNQPQQQAATPAPM